MTWKEIGVDPITGAVIFRSGAFTVLLGKPGTKEYKETGRWHLSISHPHRYPDWDTIANARYALIPDDVTMMMYLPPQAEYVNIHNNCFHLHESREVF